jgi:hypothetical protein
MAESLLSLGPWRDIRPKEAADLLTSIHVPWWVAGGWALDLFLGNASRRHSDLDVGVLRRDLREVLRALSSWEVFEAKSGVLTPLAMGQMPQSDVHSLWCRPTRTDLWTLELMLDEADGDMWLFRRRPAVRRALCAVIRRDSEDLPYLAPEVQLLYKAQRPRKRDHADFNRTSPLLDPVAREWLLDALARIDPAHEWIPALQSQRTTSPS